MTNLLKYSIARFCVVVFLHSASTALAGNLPENDRVKKARKIWSAKIDSTLQASGINPGNFDMLITVSKSEQELRIYAAGKKSERKMILIRSMPVCAVSGIPGPKNKQGDDQIPEGFYYINRFNPQSRFHLAMQISYPNTADIRRNPSGNYGNHIMLHGSCVTIGCIPLTNPGIEELYVYCLKASENGQKKIPVYIFPAWPDGAGFQDLCKEYKNQPWLLRFWNNLRQGYLVFRKTAVPLKYSCARDGSYIFKE